MENGQFYVINESVMDGNSSTLLCREYSASRNPRVQANLHDHVKIGPVTQNDVFESAGLLGIEVQVPLRQRVADWAVHIFREHTKDADSWAGKGFKGREEEWVDIANVVWSEVTGLCGFWDGWRGPLQSYPTQAGGLRVACGSGERGIVVLGVCGKWVCQTTSVRPWPTGSNRIWQSDFSGSGTSRFSLVCKGRKIIRVDDRRRGAVTDSN